MCAPVQNNLIFVLYEFIDTYVKKDVSTRDPISGNTDSSPETGGVNIHIYMCASKKNMVIHTRGNVQI